MRSRQIELKHQEPIGIVIADGGRGDATPKFSAFVWGPAPEDDVLELEVEHTLAAVA